MSNLNVKPRRGHQQWNQQLEPQELYLFGVRRSTRTVILLSVWVQEEVRQISKKSLGCQAAIRFGQRLFNILLFQTHSVA